MKTEQEIKLEGMLLKAWAETVIAEERAKESIHALRELNARVH